MYVYYNPNPSGKMVGDCVIRGISKLADQTWNETFIGICATAFDMKDMPSANQVWESYLLSNGFVRRYLEDRCPLCYTVQDFCRDFRSGKYLLATGSHVIAVEDGDYYDAWDSGHEVPMYYWSKGRS